MRLRNFSRFTPLVFFGALFCFTPLDLHAQACALNVSPGAPASLVSTAVTYCSLTVSAGATLFIGGAVTLTVTGNTDIEGMVEGNSNGYGALLLSLGTPPGAGSGDMGGSGGGGHGGAGGSDSSFTGGSTYDNPLAPVLPGSPGGSFCWPSTIILTTCAFPCPGGGAFILNAPSGSVLINGTIDMGAGYGGNWEGFADTGGGGGAGGTISISAHSITFNGFLNAAGGAGSSDSGGGGGGLILLCSTLAPLTGTGTYSVAGGAGGSGGNPGGNGAYNTCATFTPTPTASPAPTASLTPTTSPTPTDTPQPCNGFTVSKNLFMPSQGPVSIGVDSCQGSGKYVLGIYNSAGESVKTLQDGNLIPPIHQGFTWDGTNFRGDLCASGVYLIYLQTPQSSNWRKVLLVR